VVAHAVHQDPLQFLPQPFTLWLLVLLLVVPCFRVLRASFVVGMGSFPNESILRSTFDEDERHLCMSPNHLPCSADGKHDS
jgi:hypothetical protein